VLDTIRYAGTLARRVRELEPDLVHTNSLKSAVYGLAAGRTGRVPVVWHIRDRNAADYLPTPAVRAVRVLSRVGPSAVLANSRTTLATLPGARRGRVVPNAVPQPSVHATAPDGPVQSVGVIGRLAPWKGQHVFLEAFAQAFPDPSSTRAVVIGGALFGEDDYERQLHDVASTLGIGSRTNFRGHLADPSQARADLDVVVHCSTIPEPFGQVVVEAMATGVPVVAAGAGGPAEVITDGQDGLLAPPGDRDALAACLTRLSDDLGLRERLVAAGRRRALDFTPERSAVEVLACYDEVLRR
jgi:glycosyltransferase involved in cell wall biosynthesis